LAGGFAISLHSTRIHHSGRLHTNEEALMVLLLSETDVAGILSMRDGIRVVEKALADAAAAGRVALPRISADVPGNGGAFRVMSAIAPDPGFFGLKTLTGYPGRRLPGETYFVVLLFGCDTGALRAVIAGTRLTGIRTGAASGVAAKYLARPDARTLGVIGAGVQARYQVAAVGEVRSISDVKVFDLDSDKARTFAREIALDFQVAANAVGSAKDAVTGCDLVVTATASTSPVFDGSWLEDGTHLSGVGSNSPNKRELDALTFRRSTVVVDFKDQALVEAGDLRNAISEGALQADSIHGEIGDVITGVVPGRRSPREITLFKSVGMAIEDVATAAFAYEQALAAGVGTFVHLDRTAASLPSRTLPRVETPAM
jgi:ornithine cyclodeaminase/alanine dehydrogenase